MKLLSKLALASTLVASLVGGVALADKAAKPAAPAPSTAAAPSQADVAKYLAFFDKLVDLVIADQDHCTKLATDVNALIDANLALVKQGADAQTKGMELPDAAKDHIVAAQQRLAPALTKCAKDKSVQAAFTRMRNGGATPSHK